MVARRFFRRQRAHRRTALTGARLRVLLSRRPWVQRSLIGVLAIGTTATVSHQMTAVRTERDAWGTVVTVWVTTRDIAQGEPVVARRRSVPLGIRPTAAAADPVGEPALRPIGHGEIVTDLDIAAVSARPDTVPAGWLIAPVVESIRSGAEPGDRVRVVGDGFVIAPDGIVTAVHDDVTLVAVPADDAPSLPQHGVALLLVP